MAVDRLLQKASTEITHIEPAVAAARLGDMLVIDVREPWEVLHGYLPGAVNVPRGLLEFRAEDDGAFRTPGRPILVYSGDGRRSALAAQALQQLGFADVYSLAGGFRRWLQEERPVA